MAQSTRVLAEQQRRKEFASIEFRDTPSGRIAYMQNSRLPVYWVIKVAMSYDMDIDKVLAYWPDRSRAWAQSALDYYAAYPEEINTQIAQHDSISFETLNRQFPQIEAFPIPQDVLSEE